MLQHRTRHCIVACFALLLNLIAAAVSAEPVTTIRNHGDPSNRVDLVVLGDGYTSGELATYAQDVERFIQGMFAEEPFREYQHYFNVHRIDVTSTESGADHPASKVFRATALDAFYDCNGIQRLICVNLTNVNAVLSRSVAPDERDMVLIIVNDPEYGGSGGAVAVASVHSDVIEVVLHELGHSFGLLGDEYTDPQLCSPGLAPEPNVTTETDRANVKWNVGGGPPTGWIDPATPVPTPPVTPGIPGLYEGARYCPTGIYRPTLDSKMRSLFRPFEQINTEQIIKRIYNRVSPIDSVDPMGSTVTLAQDSSRTFTIETPEPLTRPLAVRWTLDGDIVATGSQLTLNWSDLSPGVHSLQVVVADETDRVINDPQNILIETHDWIVTVEIAVRPTVTVSASGSVTEAGGTAATFTVNRTGSTASPTTVNYTVAGSAVPNVDYVALSGSVVIVSGESSATIMVIAVNDSTVEGPETVTLKLQANPAYNLGNPNSATVTIIDESALSIGTGVLPEGEVKVPYAANIAVNGGAPPYAVSRVKGSLPRGLTLNADTLTISGIPRQAGTSKFTLRVGDESGTRADVKLTIRILKALTIATRTLKRGKVGRAYVAGVRATQGKPPYNWSMSGAVPAGLAFDPSAARISGTPSTSGTTALTFEVSDSLGAVRQKTLKITIQR